MKHNPAMADRPKLASQWLTTLFAAFCTVAGSGVTEIRAEDIDIYLNAKVVASQAPITALALDLPSSTTAVICANPLAAIPTPPPSPPADPSTPPDPATTELSNCLKVQKLLTVQDVLTLAGNPSGVLTGILGGLDPTTTISQLDPAQLTQLNTLVATLTGAATGTGPLPPLNEQVLYYLAINKILQNLFDSRLLILLSHANAGGPRATTPDSTGGFPPPPGCSFADQMSISDASSRRSDTKSCSNGAYVYVGLHDLTNPIQLQQVVDRLARALLPVRAPDPANPTAPPSFRSPSLSIGPNADSPFQAKEIYLELAKYLRGDRIYNGHLGNFDYGDNDPNNNLDTTLPPLSWDEGAERDDERYKRVLSDPEYVNACTINLVSLQVRDSSAQDESDDEIRSLFPGVDLDGDNKLSLAELVQTAGKTGFKFGGSDARKINSYFVVKENLADAEALASTGNNVTTYTNLLGVIERGKEIAGSVVPVLTVDASVGTVSVSSDRNSKTGQGLSAYIPVFRPLADKKPNWPGNLKQLRFEPTSASDATLRLAAQNDSDAISKVDGKIKPTALTYWTNASKIGANSGDGYVADLGGAGQNIPGFKYLGGGVPGRANPSPASAVVRTLYYDSYSGSLGPKLSALNPDDSAVRTDVTAAVGASPYTDRTVLCGDDSGLKTSCQTQCETDNRCGSMLLPEACRTNCSLATCGLGAVCPFTRTADTITKERLLHARGYDVGTEAKPKPFGTTGSTRTDPTGGSTSTSVAGRPWLLGAVMHSRPVAVNYGKRGGGSDSDIRVVYGSADGYLHLVDNKTGVENWAFMPQTVMNSLKVQRDNDGALYYGVDGPATVIIKDRKGTSTSKSSADLVIDRATSSDNDRAWVFFGLRRGTNAPETRKASDFSPKPQGEPFAGYYALDITNPDKPEFMWSIGRNGLNRKGTTGVVAGTANQFSSIALPFSSPQAGVLMLPVSTGSSTLAARSVLFFGGGYNGGSAGAPIGKDVKGAVGTNDFAGINKFGNALFVVDAETGALIWKAEGTTASSTSYDTAKLSFANPQMDDGIASDVTVLDTDSDGITDRLYVGDTGGRLWRGDFVGTDLSKWSMIRLADIGRHVGTASLTDDRRMFHAPDFVPIRSRNQAIDVVLFGTGNREDPLDTTTVNWVYALKDTDVVSGKTPAEIANSLTGTGAGGLVPPAQQANFSDFTDSCATVGSTCDDIANLSTTQGWRIKLTRPGEKMTSAPLTARGTTNFTTFFPPSLACIPQEGEGSIYSISARSSAPRPFVNQVTGTRYSALRTPGLAGEITATTSGNAAGNQLFKPKELQKNYRAGWAERVGDDEKKVPQ